MKAELYSIKRFYIGEVDLPPAQPYDSAPKLIQLHGTLFTFDHPVYSRASGLPILVAYCYYEARPVILGNEVIPQLKRRSP